MKNLNEHRFEEEWRSAFEEAKAAPHADVWARIDAHLANQEAEKYKRKLIWYQRIAAAVLLLLLATGSAWYWLDRASGTSTGPVAVKDSVRTDAQNNRNPTIAAVGKDAARKEGRAPVESPAAEVTEPSEQTGQPEAGPDALARNQPGKSGQTVPGDESGSQPLAATRPYTNPANELSRKSARKNQVAQREDPTKLVESFDPNQPSLVNQDHSIRTIGESSPKERMVSHEKGNDRQETHAENLAYEALAARAIAVKESPIRTPMDVPQLTNLYLAQLQHEDDKSENKEDKAESEAGRWQIGLAFAPTYFNPNMNLTEGSAGYQASANASYYALNASAADASTFQQANRELEQTSPSGLSYQSGIHLEYAVSKRISVQSGVDYLYSRSSIATSTYVEYLNSGAREPVYASLVNYAQQPAAESFVASEAEGEVLKLSNARSLNQTSYAVPVQNNYEYIAIPVKVNYLLVNRKVGATMGAGVSADVFLKNTFGNESEGINEVKIVSTKGTAYRTLGLSAWLGMKLHFRFSKRYSAFIEPSYRRAVTSFTNPAAFQSHPYAFSIGTGLQVRL